MYVTISEVLSLTKFLPHRLVGLDEALLDGSQDVLVVIGPEDLLPNDEIHQVFLLMNKKLSLAHLHPCKVFFVIRKTSITYYANWIVEMNLA